ncbi:MAG TPA: hypothetical protein VFY14_14300, partial [Streptomyces sp.]|nr:hypothetical protein [Streptomyces sp.]
MDELVPIAVALERRNRALRRGLGLLRHPLPDCPTCGTTPTEITAARPVDPIDTVVRFRLNTCGHVFVATETDAMAATERAVAIVTREENQPADERPQATAEEQAAFEKMVQLSQEMGLYPNPVGEREPAVPAVGDRYTNRADPNRTVTITRVWEAADGPAIAFEWRDGQPGQCGGSLPLDVFHRAYQPAVPAPADDAHQCKPGASTYYCPASGETESDCHGGFDVCCGRPDLHQPLLPCSAAHLRPPHGPHSWEPQPGMSPVRCLGYGTAPADDGRHHVYLSTGCFHGEHGYCQGKDGMAGPKQPASCKFCKAPCVCGCHQGEPAASAPADNAHQCGARLHKRPETACTLPARHDGCHDGPLMVGGRQVGSASWDDEDTTDRASADRRDVFGRVARQVAAAVEAARTATADDYTLVPSPHGQPVPADDDRPECHECGDTGACAGGPCALTIRRERYADAFKARDWDLTIEERDDLADAAMAVADAELDAAHRAVAEEREHAVRTEAEN